MQPFLSALFLQAGYNTALVTVGSAILGASAGAIGAFVLLRKRSLVSDAISHGTLPGLVLAFILMSAVWGEGRFMPGLLLGATISAALGLVAVEWMTRRTRLAEDAAIGAVLSVFFGLGVVLLTIVQSLQSGGQAGLEGFLLGSTASMLRSEALTIAVAAAVVGLAVFALRRPFTLVSFDRDYAVAGGLDVKAVDLAMMALTLLVTVIGLRVAGLILIVALTIIPPVAARFWTNRPSRMVMLSAGIGAASAYLGALISSLDANLPTGALIVLVAFALFLASLVFSPVRGLLAERLQRRGLRHGVLLRQGLLVLSEGRAPEDRATIAILRCAGLIDARGSPTLRGGEAARAAVEDERLLRFYHRRYPVEASRLRLSADPLAEQLDEPRLLELRREMRSAGAG